MKVLKLLVMVRKSKITVYFVLLGFFYLALSNLGAADNTIASNMSEIETVLAGVEYYDSLTEKIQVNFTWEWHLTEDALRSPMYKGFRGDEKSDGELTLSGIQFCLRAKEPARLPDGNQMQVSSTHSFDGELLRILSVPVGVPLDVNPIPVPTAAIRRPDAETTPFNYKTPLLFNLSMKSMWLGKFMKQFGAKILRKEILGDSECYLVECSRGDGYLVTAWIDPNSGYRAKKLEVHDPKGELVGNCETKLAQYEGGLWFPISGVATTYGKKETGERVLFITESIVVSKVVVNPSLPNSYFTTISFPPGTRVSDQVVGIEYVAPE